jgi:adenylate cyclase
MKRIRTVVRFSLPLVCGLLPLGLSGLGAFDLLELQSLDRWFRIRGPISPDPRVAVVAIDGRSLEAVEEPLIFWNGFLADVVMHLSSGGAAVLGIDILQPKSLDRWTREDYDRQLQRAILQARNRGTGVVLGYTTSRRWDGAGVRVTESIPELTAAVEGQVGFYNLTPDADRVVRGQHLILRDQVGGAVYPSFATLVAANVPNVRFVFDGNRPRWGEVPVPEEKGRMLINFVGPPGKLPTYSFEEALQAARRDDVDFFRTRFDGRVVLIGATAPEMQDLYAIPFSTTSSLRMSGVEIHANIVHTLLSGDFIRRIPASIRGLTVVMLGALVGAICLCVRPSVGLLVVVGGMGGVILACFRLFEARWWMDMVAPLTGMPLAYGITFIYRFTAEDRGKRLLKRAFSRYVNPHVAEEIAQDPEGVGLAGQRRKVTVLFSDIRGFTALSETLPPEEVVAFLSQYLEAMTEVVFEFDGTLDKFIGDGIMVLYGTPVGRPDDARRAVRTALRMCERLQELNRQRKGILSRSLRIGVGIHTGEVIVGNLGSLKKMEYTAIGDTVNLASRIEGLNKEFGTTILVSEVTYREVADLVVAKSISDVTVRGREEKVTLYSVTGLREDVVCEGGSRA